MEFDWINKRVLITIRTYPVPAQKGIEVSCTAGITDDGQWIRLFPVPYRFLEKGQRFKKYQWIDVSVKKAPDDTRPESFKLNPDTIKVISTVSTDDQWLARKMRILPLKCTSLCEMERKRQVDGFPTLGIFKPARIKRLLIVPCDAKWTRSQRAALGQQLLFGKNTPRDTLEKIPYEFRYEFKCDDVGCTGHNMMCTDWEIGESYRKWSQEYESKWEAKFRKRYEEEMINKCDTHFYVGTVHGHPGAWIIVGLFYPPHASTLDFYGSRS